MHHVDRGTPWEEIWQAMEQLVREGKVLYVGSSNFAGWHVAQACEAAKARHFLGLVSEQGLYHLLERTAEKYDLAVDWHPKPLGDTDWNGSGMHANFSNGAMRDLGESEGGEA